MAKLLCKLAIVWILSLPVLGWSWNALGHKIIAQIAYHHLDESARVQFDHFNEVLNSAFPSKSFVASASWLDMIKQQDVSWFNTYHYDTIYFSTDFTPLPEAKSGLGLEAIEASKRTLLSSKSTEIEKGMSLRILIHVIGDLHQPLHTVSKVSQAQPNGDKGGNLFPLGKNDIGKNLHSYWDNGAGLLLPAVTSESQIEKLALDIEAEWPCIEATVTLPAKDWQKESFTIAVNQSYKLKASSIPSARYQKQAQKTTQERLALAGCRLAYVLNQMNQKYKAR